VVTDSVFITSAIEAYERRHAMTMDIPGAFLHTEKDEEIHMLLRGQLAKANGQDRSVLVGLT
jgi:hypothetical protein